MPEKRKGENLKVAGQARPAGVNSLLGTDNDCLLVTRRDIGMIRLLETVIVRPALLSVFSAAPVKLALRTYSLSPNPLIPGLHAELTYAY